MDPLKWPEIIPKISHPFFANNLKPHCQNYRQKMTKDDKSVYLFWAIPVSKHSPRWFWTLNPKLKNLQGSIQKIPGKTLEHLVSESKCPRLHFPIPILSRTVLSTVVSPKKELEYLESMRIVNYQPHPIDFLFQLPHPTACMVYNGIRYTWFPQGALWTGSFFFRDMLWCIYKKYFGYYNSL